MKSNECSRITVVFTHGLLDFIEHKEMVIVGRCKRMTRWNGLESEEHECSDQNRSIDAIFLKADKHMGTAEYFFGVFKKRYKCLFATFWQRPSKRKVESATCNHGFPHSQSLFSKLKFKTQMCTSVLRRTHHLFLRHCFGWTSAGHRGLCRVPHAAALCAARRHDGGMGDIKPTTEAQRPGEWKSGAKAPL